MGNSIVSEVVPRKNRLLVCPECGGMLSGDRDAYTSNRGFIYRERKCRNCGYIFHTRQAPEEITGVEAPLM